MKTHRWVDLQHKISSKRRTEIEQEVEQSLLEMDLRALREASGKTQEELAGLAEMSQPQLSQLENRENPRLTTLRRYIRALGGEIEVTAVVDGKRVKLSGI